MGISFVTFEAISLLADIYNTKIKKNPDILSTYLYLTFFPTITSGPIIRYNEFENGLLNINQSVLGSSIERIIIGLSKKVLVADKLAFLANYYFDGVAAGNSFSSLGLWIGSIAYTLQLYFDFSGYSDMAIGIGQLLGFNISENFDKPYRTCSISEFWKKWHKSLTLWFRDYIYIPLGGNRVSKIRHIVNMLIVWLITGLWHGADWTFIIWGIGYFLLLTAEKYIPVMKKICRGFTGHVYTLVFVNFLWIPFRAVNLKISGRYIAGMFGGGSYIIENKAIRFLPFLILAVIICFPLEKLLEKVSHKKMYSIIKGLFLIALAFFSICAAVNSSYSPYIYGNF